jgi:UDP-2-acetamido-3-amino-2,3-dideoxy-glucuronate N-acetyltransferase
MEVFIHPLAEVKTTVIGVGTRVWQFVVILPGARIGRNCNICSHVFIENDVVIGDEVTIKNGVQIWDGVRIGNKVFIGPNVTFTNDRVPRAWRRDRAVIETYVGDGASIGANSTILAGCRIGRYAMVGAGSVVTRDVGDFELWYGNPARKRGYVTCDGEILTLELINRKTGAPYIMTENGPVVRE